MKTSSSALTLAAVSQHVGSVMETTTVETCPMNRTVASQPHRQVFRQSKLVSCYFLANILRYVRYMLSAVRLLSVCLLSVCDVGAPYSGG